MKVLAQRLDRENSLRKMEKKKTRGPSRVSRTIPDTTGKQLVVVESPVQIMWLLLQLGTFVISRRRTQKA